jgi:hypothetical protein
VGVMARWELFTTVDAEDAEVGSRGKQD